jgi:hypothetical protein
MLELGRGLNSSKLPLAIAEVVRLLGAEGRSDEDDALLG